MKEWMNECAYVENEMKSQQNCAAVRLFGTY